MSNDIDNIYQAPKTNVDITTSRNAGQIWRYKSSVVVTRDSVWPNRCIKCNELTDSSINRNLAYVNPWIYLTILISILITLILGLIFRKNFRFEIPVCERHRKRRSKVILINWLLFLTLIAGITISIAENQPFGALAALICLLAIIIIGLPNRLAYVAKYKDPYIYVRGAKKAFLNSLDDFSK